MREEVVHAFLCELEKTAGLGDLWENMRTLIPSVKRAREDVDAHIKSTDPERFDRLVEQAKLSPEVLRQLKLVTKDEKLVRYVESLADLHHAKPVGTVEGNTPGSKYEIRELPGGRLGCLCSDWRFRGSTNPEYECKHVKAHKAGQAKLASFNTTTMAFFDELARLSQKARESATSHFGNGDRPFSSLLTQEEEPTDYNPRPAAPPDEPVIIIGGRR